MESISPEEQEKVKGEIIKISKTWISVIFLFTAEVISLVDEQIGSRSHGRLFACVYFDGAQVSDCPQLFIWQRNN